VHQEPELQYDLDHRLKVAVYSDESYSEMYQTEKKETKCAKLFFNH